MFTPDPWDEGDLFDDCHRCGIPARRLINGLCPGCRAERRIRAQHHAERRDPKVTGARRRIEGDLK